MYSFGCIFLDVYFWMCSFGYIFLDVWFWTYHSVLLFQALHGLSVRLADALKVDNKSTLRQNMGHSQNSISAVRLR